MLQYLRISNLALLEEAELEFGPGFICVTGETGAGKSVLLGALALLSGARAEKTLIRKDAATLEVEAGLAFPDTRRLDAMLENQGLPPCEDGVLLLRRTIPRERMARIAINGGMATLGALREVGEAWIDFHGPGEPQKLFHERYQLEMLDAFAQNMEPREGFRQAYRQWRSLLQKARQLKEAERLDPEEIEILRGQLAKIDVLQVSEESIEALERDYRRLSQAQEWHELTASIEEALRGEEGALPRLGQAMGLAQRLQELAAEVNEPTERLKAAIIELEDVAETLAQLGSELDIDEESASDIQHRMDQWMDLRRRHGGSVGAVLRKRGEIAERIASQGDIDGRITQLEHEAQEAASALARQAASMTERRREAAERLATEATRLLAALGFKKADFRIEIVPEEELREHGDSHCEFLFRPNAGQELLPLNKIASSGETARVMLALKTVLAQVDATPVLVFDEVDANVGGEVGAKVGAELARLASSHQVFCVTHLPQVAAQGQQHLLVEKLQEEDSTQVTIHNLTGDPASRELELARMLGDRKSASARQHARELLGQA